MTVNEMKAEGAKIAETIHNRFGFDVDVCCDAARFIVLIGEALGTCERKLNEQGKTLSQKGMGFVIGETIKAMQNKS